MWLSVVKAIGGTILRGRKSNEGPDKADRILDATMEYIDDRKFTPEERARQQVKVIDGNLEFVKQNKEENSVRSKARRAIAEKIIDVHLSLLLLSAIVYKFDPEYAEHLYLTAMVLDSAVVAVILFYFGYYGAQKVVGLFTRKKKEA
jgi:hypothetical protein